MSDGLRDGRITAPFTRMGRLWRNKDYQRQLTEKNAIETRQCATCGAPALYRFYKASGEQFGACKTHAAALQEQAPYFAKREGK